jgi:hypothetical protein
MPFRHFRSAIAAFAGSSLYLALTPPPDLVRDQPARRKAVPGVPEKLGQM